MPLFEKASVKAMMMILTAASGAYATSSVVIPYLTSAQGNGFFILTLSPSSLTMPEGASRNSTVNLASMNGFTGTVTLSLTYVGQSLPATLEENNLSLSAAGTATTTLTVTAPINATLGSYDIIVTANGIGHKKTLFSSALLSVAVYSPVLLTTAFNLLADPSTINNVAGTTDTTGIFITSFNNFSGNITLTATVPFGWIGVMGGKNPVYVAPNATATTTLQITTAAETQPGTYQILVTGTSGSESTTATVTVNVTSSTVEGLRLTSYTFASSTSLTMYLQNVQNSQITLVTYIVRDANGNSWFLANWAGPIIGPGETASANILIWTSCSGCYYTGVLGTFHEFAIGQTYTVVLIADIGTQFTYKVTR